MRPITIPKCPWSPWVVAISGPLGPEIILGSILYLSFFPDLLSSSTQPEAPGFFSGPSAILGIIDPELSEPQGTRVVGNSHASLSNVAHACRSWLS